MLNLLSKVRDGALYTLGGLLMILALEFSVRLLMILLALVLGAGTQAG